MIEFLQGTTKKPVSSKGNLQFTIHSSIFALAHDLLLPGLMKEEVAV